MKIKTYIFDLDGTLLDTLTDLKNSVNFALSVFNLPLRTESEIRSFIGNGVEKLIERAAFPLEDIEMCYEILKKFKEHYKQHCADTTQPYYGIVAVLAELDAKNCKIAVVSNKSHQETEALTQKFFGCKIDFVQGSTADLPRKPDPSGVLTAMERLSAEAQTTVYIGDCDVDVETAKNAKVTSIGVTWGFRDKSVLESAGADIILDNPCDLLKIGVR